MKSYIIYNSSGEILRSGTCADSDYNLQAKLNESIMEGVVKNDVIQKVVFDGVDRNDDPIPFIIEKTQEEMLIENPVEPEVPHEQQTVIISNKEWQSVLNRLTQLER